MEKKMGKNKNDEDLTKQAWCKKYSKKKIICLPKYMKGRKTLIFENMVECSNYFGISLFYLKDLIESGTVYKQYFFDLEV